LSILRLGIDQRSGYAVNAISPDKRAVLVIDDDADARDALASLLEREGYRAAQVENGQQALEHLQVSHQQPAVILLDLDMPVMDGRQFLARLPQIRGSVRPIVIVITGQDPRIVPGAVAVFRKPVQLDQLLRLMQQLLNEQ
jgi:two-component system chemotaxis response regulator CheY